MEASVEIWIFHCGQGDTLLVRLDGEKWVLVDCNLPGEQAVDRFLAELKRLGVQRLDLVCLSHPDTDHFRGMEHVLAHYATGSRSLGIFCDAGFAAKLANAPASARIEPEIVRLYDLVFSLEDAGSLAYFMATAHHDARAENEAWPEQLATVSPVGSKVQAATYRSLLGHTRESPNEYSMVLMLESGVGVATFRGLLTGDAGGQTLAGALGRTPEAKETRFDFAKVAHHGSWASHQGSPVPDRIRDPGKSVAVVSASSTSKKLPRREVLNDYLKAGWQVYDTGRRSESQTGTLLSHATFWPDTTEAKHDISVTWSPVAGIAAAPEAARVTAEHTHLYPNAGASPTW